MSQGKTGISRSIARMTVVPLIVFGIITMLFSFIWIRSSLEAEVHGELEKIAQTAIVSIETLYPGDYRIYGDDTETLITKGDTILNGNYSLIDTLKESTDLDFTLFYGDLRIITTLRDAQENRIIGTSANQKITADVLKEGASAFYNNVEINHSRYYCYYTPLCNADGSCVGMFAAVMPYEQVYILILKAALPILILTLVAAILANLWALNNSKGFITVIRQVQTALRKTADGKLSNTVPPELLAREDEFGDMAHSVVDMQKSLRSLVEQDMLTGLNNRRFGQQKLQQIIENFQGTNRRYSVALGDIDFFKKFNDTHGHDCGDFVLQEVARELRRTVKDYGYAIRWGGEEFLLVFTNGTYQEHLQAMEHLIAFLSEHTMYYQNKSLQVTMTFGIIDASEYHSADLAVQKADELLYFGKEHGRNQLVTMDTYHAKRE